MGVDLSGSHSEMDVQQHEDTYKLFINWTKFSLVFLIIMLAGMALFLV